MRLWRSRGLVRNAGYTSSAVWVLIPALFFGFALIKTGLGKRIAYFVLKTFEPGILSMAGSPLKFLLVGTVVLWAIRFIDIPWGFTTIALLSPVFIPLYQRFGLHPVLVSVMVIAAGNSFFLDYQQPFVVMGDALNKSKAWSGKHVSTAGLLYAVAVTVGILVSSLYWSVMGPMPG